MANWWKIGSRGDVEDRRSLTPVAIGGISLTGVALLFLVNFLMGGNVGDALNQLQNVPIEQQQNVDKTDFEGQDRIQKNAGGYVNPETWTHGSSEARVGWFDKGYEIGTLPTCDTFH